MKLDNEWIEIDTDNALPKGIGTAFIVRRKKCKCNTEEIGKRNCIKLQSCVSLVLSTGCRAKNQYFIKTRRLLPFCSSIIELLIRRQFTHYKIVRSAIPL